MVYANDQWVQLPVRSLYDSQMMLSAINAAKGEYERGLLDMKDFNKEYGDFLSPILKDMDWYALNVTGKVKNAIDTMYANGIDLRSPEARAKLGLIINSVNPGDVAKLRQSAKNATQFLNEVERLSAKGLYNPLYAPYDAPDMSKYSTLGPESQGVWLKISPTPTTDLATFGNPYFEGMKPNVHKKSKNGITYDVEAITMDDIKNIADSKFNDLVNTPQGRLMYQYYRDVVGGDSNPNADVDARNMFNNAIANAQQRRTYVKDNYEDNWFKHQELGLQRARLGLERERILLAKQRAAAKARQDVGGNGTQLTGISLAKTWLDSAMANAWSADGITKNMWDMDNNYGQFGKEVDKVFHDFGMLQGTITPSRTDLLNSGLLTPKEEQYIRQYKKPLKGGYADTYKQIVDKYAKLYKNNKLSSIRESYEKQFSIPMDGKSVAEIIGTPVSGNKMQAKVGAGIINKIYGTDDIISNTAGYTKTHTTADTKRIRDAIKKAIDGGYEDNIIVTSTEKGYGSFRKSGDFSVMPNVHIRITDNNGKERLNTYGYVDIDLHSYGKKGGAYLKDYKTTGGVKTVGTPGLHYNNNTDFYQFTPQYDKNGNVIGFENAGGPRISNNDVYFTGTPKEGVREYNMYPNLNNWSGFGVWDTDLTSKKLHAGASKKLGTYLDDEDEVDILLDEPVE